MSDFPLPQRVVLALLRVASLRPPSAPNTPPAGDSSWPWPVLPEPVRDKPPATVLRYLERGDKSDLRRPRRVGRPAIGGGGRA